MSAMKHGRRFVGSEKLAKYHKLATERVASFQAGLDQHVPCADDVYTDPAV